MLLMQNFVKIIPFIFEGENVSYFSSNSELNILSNTGEAIASTHRWTWSRSCSTTRTTSLNCQGCEKSWFWFTSIWNNNSITKTLAGYQQLFSVDTDCSDVWRYFPQKFAFSIVVQKNLHTVFGKHAAHAEFRKNNSFHFRRGKCIVKNWTNNS